MKAFTIIVAVDKNLGIGIDNDLPWRLKADMAWFKKITTDVSGDKLNAVIMGRRTWESLPERFRPLPGRENIVISRSPDKVTAPHVFKTLDLALEYAYNNCEKVFIIGGASIYEQAISHRQLKDLYITKIDRTFNCDAFFPALDNFREAEIMQQGDEDGLPYRMTRYVPAL